MGMDKKKKTYSLYPYSSVELTVAFVYGIDYTRRTNHMPIPQSVQILLTVILLFICLAAIILCIIRRKFKLRPDGLFSTYIDASVAIIAGGNLRMQHKFERLFFGILLIGAFFMTNLLTGDVLFHIYRSRNQVNTFEHLATIDSPIYINPSLAHTTVQEILKFVS